MIDSIIHRLENNQDLTADEKHVVALFLKEMMSRDRSEHGLINAQMNPEMYRLFTRYAYTKNGTYKVELFKNESTKATLWEGKKSHIDDSFIVD